MAFGKACKHWKTIAWLESRQCLLIVFFTFRIMAEALNFRLAAKGFVINDGRLLLLQRRLNDVQKPGIWELPGGRLEPAEDPVEGMKREMLEETGLSVEVLMPFSVRHFTRDDGMVITMLVFLCKAFENNVRLSNEHIAFEWVESKEWKEKTTGFFHKELELYQKLGLEKLV